MAQKQRAVDDDLRHNWTERDELGRYQDSNIDRESEHSQNENENENENGNDYEYG